MKLHVEKRVTFYFLLILLGHVLFVKAQPLPYLSIELSENHELRYFNPSTLYFKACNISPLPLQGVSLTFTAKGAYVVGSIDRTLGSLQRGECKSFNVKLIPTNRTVVLTIGASVTVPVRGSFTQVTGRYDFVLPVRLNDLKTSFRIYKFGIELNVTNNSNFSSPQLILEVKSNPRECSFERTLIKIGRLKPFQSKLISVKLTQLANDACNVDIYLLDTSGKVFYKNRLRLDFVAWKPDISISPSSIVICPSLLPLDNVEVRIGASGSVVMPSHLEFKTLARCETIRYSLTYPRFPTTIKVTVFSNGTILAYKNYTISQPIISIETNTSTLLSSALNAVKLRLASPYDIREIYVVLEPSVGEVKPNSLFINSSDYFTILWSLPSLSSKTVVSLKIRIGGGDLVISKTFNVVRRQLHLALTYTPQYFIEGSYNRLKLCVTNNRGLRLSNLEIQVNSEYFKGTYVISELPNGATKCISINKIPVPWSTGYYNLTVNLSSVLPPFSESTTLKIPVILNPNAPSINITVTKKLLEPGTQTITLKVTNVGNGSLYNAVLRVEGKDVKYPTGEVPLGQLKPHESRSIKVVLQVPPKEPSAKINVYLKYCKGEVGIPCSKEVVRNEFVFHVKSYIGPRVTIIYKPQELMGGTSQEISLKACNEGDLAARNVIITFNNVPNKIEILSNSIVSIPKLMPKSCSKISLSLNVFNVEKRTSVDMPYTIRYMDKWLENFSEKGNIRVVIVPPKLAKVLVRPTSTLLIKGEDRQIKVIVRNAGSKEALNVRIYPYSPNVVLKPQQYVLKKLLAGQQVVFVINYSIPYGTYITSTNLNFLVRYYNGMRNVSETYSYPMKVVTGPKIRISDFSVYPEKPSPGSVVSIAFSVLNEGDSDGNNVRVSLSLASGIRVLGSRSVLLGTLRPLSSVPVAFIVKVPNDIKPGTYPYKVTVKYSFNGIEYTETKVGTIVVYPSLQIGTNQQLLERLINRNYLLVVIVSLVIIALVIKFVRKGRTGND